LARLGALAERYFRDDPSTALMKVRQFGEVLAQLVAARAGLFTDSDESQLDLLRRLGFNGVVPREALDLFHLIRTRGNRAVHEAAGDHSQALSALKTARLLGIWFQRTFHDPQFAPGPFTPPPDPAAATAQLHAELARLRTELDATRSEAERAHLAAEAAARARLSAEERAQREQEERTLWEQLAAETEQANAALAQQLQAIQAQAAAAPPQQNRMLIAQAEAAARTIVLDEATTRTLIDAQLRAAGWEADSVLLRYSTGARPEPGRNRAIAEWPVVGGKADYALFVGMQCIALVEAKRQNRNVAAAIDQAQRYAHAFRFTDGIEPIGGPWLDAAGAPFQVPFVFAANGRPYLKQLETASGIWFRDLREPTNLRRAVVDWHTPDGLLAMLAIDRAAAHAALADQAITFAFPLRPYQRRAIELVEAELAQDRRTMLLAMATGTGKTKLAIALLYRLLAANRFRRVCFVVDRNALGRQAAAEFATTRVVSAKTFADIFGLKGLESVAPDSETKVHICTIQSLVKRVLYADPTSAPPVDQYDLMIVDECHRGYLLDRELSDTELSFRNQDDYISKYRRVLEYFDAVKIGLTATPALHTVSIFGKPVFTYSYREAVIDGYLIDHEPPTQILTALAQDGITFAQGEQVELIDPQTGAVDLAELPDEVHFEVDDFNRRVITVPFNRAVAEELALQIDPSLPGKTLIFASSDAHADIVVDEVTKAFQEAYGNLADAAVKKITGKSTDPNQLILNFRNDTYPMIAVTVDLLTTGIDVPSITNLVFLRRVNSRILYEQMLGRATRRCDPIGKETFRIFDAVNLYATLQHLTQMKPVVANPQITLEQLFGELAQVTEEEQRATVRDQLLVQLRRRLNRLHEQARAQYEAAAGEMPEATLERLAAEAPAASAAWVQARGNLGAILDWNPDAGAPMRLPIAHHPDRVLEVRSGYGSGQKPEDFLDGFTSFVRDNLNQIAALNLVVQRPRELTRAELRNLRLTLDGMGYSDAALRKAWAEAKNEEIAASIIGFVRQAAIGDALIPFEQRVRTALQRLLAAQRWTPVQRTWLNRIAEQVIRELVVDREALDAEPFRKDGGFERLDKIFEHRLEDVLADLNASIWEKTA
jgi:type I restriction enzyme R subunit